MPVFKNITGQRFGRLLVLNRHGTAADGRIVWLCLCDCGRMTIASGHNMAAGTTRSCGCLRNLHKYTHRQSDTPTYRVWIHMLQRCNNPKDKSYKHYGGRGIKVLYEKFEDFLADMGEKPAGLSIDRIDNDGNYEPGNLRWATQSQQVANRRRDDDSHGTTA